MKLTLIEFYQPKDEFSVVFRWLRAKWTIQSGLKEYVFYTTYEPS